MEMSECICQYRRGIAGVLDSLRSGDSSQIGRAWYETDRIFTGREFSHLREMYGRILTLLPDDERRSVLERSLTEFTGNRDSATRALFRGDREEFFTHVGMLSTGIQILEIHLEEADGLMRSQNVN